MNDILPNHELLGQADVLAQNLFNEGLYKESIKQNEIINSILGYEHPLVAKNIAAAYYKLNKPALAACYFEGYMNETKSTHNDDIRAYAQYLTRAGDFKTATRIVFNQPECTNKHLDMGWFYHRKGYIKKAFEETEIGRNGAYWTGPRIPPSCPRWHGENLTDKRICIIGEAGLGDEIIFARWIPHVQKLARTTHYMTNNTLGDVFQRVFGVSPPSSTDEYDYWVPAMSLPFILKVEDPGNEPYLTADEMYIRKWSNRVDSDTIILNWSGDPDHMENHLRKFKPSTIALNIPGKFASVCMSAPTPCPERIEDLTYNIHSWEDTLAILHLSKICITCSSSVSVAAGALGIETHVLDVMVGYFTWCGAENYGLTNWFKNVRVWRQTTHASWDEPMSKLIDFLSKDSKSIRE